MKKKVQKHKLIFEEVLKQIEKEDVFKNKIFSKIAFFSKCPRFKDRPPNSLNFDRALQFLYLKNNQVDRSQALTFGKRRVCKVDSTKSHEGPSTARIIKNNGARSGTINGWYNGQCDIHYDMGNNYKTKVINENDQIFEEFLKHESMFPSDFKSKLKDYNQYYEQLDSKFKFSGIDQQELVDKLQKIKENSLKKSETPQDFVEVGGQRLFEILEVIKPASGPIKFNQTPRKLQIQQLNPGDSINADIDIKRRSITNQYKVPKLANMFNQSPDRNGYIASKFLLNTRKLVKRGSMDSGFDSTPQQSTNRASQAEEVERTPRRLTVQGDHFVRNNLRFKSIPPNIHKYQSSRTTFASPLRESPARQADTFVNNLVKTIQSKHQGPTPKIDLSQLKVQCEVFLYFKFFFLTQQIQTLRDREIGRIFKAPKQIGNQDILYFLKTHR